MGSKSLYKSVVVNDESELDNCKFYLDYYILEKDIWADGFSVNTYGIEVCKHSNAENASKMEYRKIYDIFCTRRETEAAIEKLARNEVTPVGVLDVLESIIGIDDVPFEESMVSSS